MERPAEIFAEGAVSLRAVLSASSREVYEVFVLPQKKNPQKKRTSEREIVVEIARARGIPITECDRDFFDRNASGNTHGGLMARVGERRLVSAKELVDTPNPFFAYLCGIEDPYNFAACLRTLYAAGCNGVFLPERNWMSAGSVILRASAGASEYLKLALAPVNAEDFLALLSSRNITPICARESRAKDLYSAPLSRPLCLMIGGERRGIDKTLDKAVERGVIIPYAGSYRGSLSAQAACAVISFELLRRTREEHTK